MEAFIALHRCGHHSFEDRQNRLVKMAPAMLRHMWIKVEDQTTK